MPLEVRLCQGFVKNTMLPLGPVYPYSWNDVVDESQLWLGTGMVYVVDFLPFSVTSESSLMHVHFFPGPELFWELCFSRLGCFLDFRFCPVSMLFAAIWSWKLPFQRYLPHVHFPWYLQQVGAQTVHLTW